MIYIGHFSFFGAEGSETQSSGFFNCVAEAESVEAAMDKFAELLENLKQSDDVFDGVDYVFCDQCTEVKSVPDAGFLDFWMAVEPEPTSTITTALRGAGTGDVTAFVIGSDEGDDEEEQDTEPFICWAEDDESE